MRDERFFLSLTCPSCGGELCGGHSARIYVCFMCKKAFIMDEFPESLPLLVYLPKIAPAAEPFYLPFFKIDGKFSFTTRYSEKERTYLNMNPLKNLYYPAFLNIRSLYSEDLTVRYALGLDDVELEDIKGPVKMVDGTRNPAKLETIARLVWLSYFDKMADVTGISASFELSQVSYCLVPFEKSEDGLKELMLGLSLKGFSEIVPNE